MYQWRIQDFPEVGAPTLQGEAAPTYDFAKTFQKLHEIERICTPKGVLVLLKLYWAPDIVEFVLGRF